MNRLTVLLRRLSSSSSPPLKESIVNVPNTLSFSRILSAPVISYALLHDCPKLALGLFTCAAVSDVVDGVWARKFNQQTVVGSFLDPMSDKVMMITVTASLGAIALLSPWAVALLVAKDVALMTGTVIVRVHAVKSFNPRVLFNVRDVPVSRVTPSFAGKFAATSVVVLLGTALVAHAFPPFLSALGCVQTTSISPCIKALEYTAVGSTVLAALHYYYLHRQGKVFPKL